MFWMIEEGVGGRYYIVLPGTYTTKEAAKAAFPDHHDQCRAVEYQQGRGTNGPERVNSIR